MLHRSRTRLAMSRVVTVLLLLVLGGGLAAGGGMFYVQRSLAAIPTFQESPDAGSEALYLPARKEGIETFLIFSTGSKDLDQQEAERTGIKPGGERGADGLSDTLMLLVVDHSDRSGRILSIPRDTWVKERETKINALYMRYGAQELADTVTDLTGMEVNHMISVNFAAFADLTDAVGGVPVHVEKPIRDEMAGLKIEETGCVLLDGRTALGWVRSRSGETQDAKTGKWSKETNGDFGRIQRQHAFLRQALRKILGPQLVTRVPELMRIAQENVTVDEGLGLTEMVTVARVFKTGDAERFEMYTYPGEVGRRGGQSVVLPDQEAAASILERVRGDSPPAGPVPAAPGGPPAPAEAPVPAEAPEQSPVPPTCT